MNFTFSREMVFVAILIDIKTTLDKRFFSLGNLPWTSIVFIQRNVHLALIIVVAKLVGVFAVARVATVSDFHCPDPTVRSHVLNATPHGFVLDWVVFRTLKVFIQSLVHNADSLIVTVLV